MDTFSLTHRARASAARRLDHRLLPLLGAYGVNDVSHHLQSLEWHHHLIVIRMFAWDMA